MKKYCSVCNDAWIEIDNSEKNKKYICTMCEDNDVEDFKNWEIKSPRKSDDFTTSSDAGN